MRLGRKLLHLAAVVLAVTALTFLVLDVLPLSVAHQVAGAGATAGDIAAIRERLGLDDPVLVRYGRWLADAVRGELGASFTTGEEVTKMIGHQLPVTLELLALAQLMALALAVPAAIFAAWQPDTALDRALGAAGFALTAVPNFGLGMLLILLFSLGLNWFPATGFTPLADGLWGNLRSMLLPAASIALGEWVVLMRVLRADLIGTLQEDFILLARAKGLPVRSILLRHALKPSCFSLITLLGVQVGNLIGGVVIIENLFALPGIGRLLLSGIFAQDFPVVQGCVLVISVGYVLVDFLVEAGYALLDPRIRKEGALG